MPAPSLPAVLDSIGHEMQALGALGTSLQAGLGRVTINHDSSSVEEFQALDVLTQRLFDLANFLSALARCVPQDCQPDLSAGLRGLTLGHLQRRLSALPDVKAEAGELEVF